MMKAMYKITSVIRSAMSKTARLLGAIACAMMLLGAGPSAWATTQATTTTNNILILGDSLSSAYGLSISDGWAAMLQNRLLDLKLPYKVVNSSITGDTSANGLSRLADLLEQHQPAVVIIELGGNDGLRGLSIKKLRSNLSEMVELASNAGSQALLVGMQIPVNYGAAYARMFSESFPLVASETNSALVPFLLEGFALNPDYFQDDGIHPNKQAQQLMLDNVWPELEPLLQ